MKRAIVCGFDRSRHSNYSVYLKPAIEWGERAGYRVREPSNFTNDAIYGRFDDNFPSTPTRNENILSDINALYRSDALLLCHGWEDYAEATLLFQTATIMKKEVICVPSPIKVPHE